MQSGNQCSGCKVEVNSRLQALQQQTNYPQNVFLSAVPQNRHALMIADENRCNDYKARLDTQGPCRVQHRTSECIILMHTLLMLQCQYHHTTPIYTHIKQGEVVYQDSELSQLLTMLCAAIFPTTSKTALVQYNNVYRAVLFCHRLSETKDDTFWLFVQTVDSRLWRTDLAFSVFRQKPKRLLFVHTNFTNC